MNNSMPDDLLGNTHLLVREIYGWT